MAHKGHSECVYTSKAACDLATKVAIGRCVSMIEEDRQCAHWGIDRVDDRPYCGVHLNSVFLAADAAKREIARKADINRRIDAYMAWTALHPSVVEQMPRDWSPA